MATARLPENPDLRQLRTRARELQRGVRAADPDALTSAGLDRPDPGYPLHLAQLAIARRYGFGSWARLQRQVGSIGQRIWQAAPAPAGEPAADGFVRLACVAWDGKPPRAAEARALLAADPELAHESVAVAAAAAQPPAIAAHLARDPRSAAAVTGPYGWPPLMYLAYSRVDAGIDDTLGAARVLLDAGADVNEGRFFLGLPTPFTVLTGVFGGGEHDEPPHPHARALGRLLLERGAEANDGQTLYNRMFGADDDVVELLLEFGLGRGDGGPWRARLPDLLDPPVALVRQLLGWAVAHDQRHRVAMLAAHGVDVLGRLEQVGPLPSGATPLEVALTNGHRELARQLRELGASEPVLDPVRTLVAAALAGDAATVRGASPDVLDEARRARPGLLAWAAAQGRTEAVELLVAAGWDVDALGRGDAPIEQPWQTALHSAVERDDAAMVSRLLALGADPGRHDARFDATPAAWAEHLGHRDLLPLFET